MVNSYLDAYRSSGGGGTTAPTKASSGNSRLESYRTTAPQREEEDRKKKEQERQKAAERLIAETKRKQEEEKNKPWYQKGIEGVMKGFSAPEVSRVAKDAGDFVKSVTVDPAVTLYKQANIGAANNQGVSPEAVKNQAKFLDSQVKEGKITQQEADKRKAKNQTKADTNIKAVQAEEKKQGVKRDQDAGVMALFDTVGNLSGAGAIAREGAKLGAEAGRSLLSKRVARTVADEPVDAVPSVTQTTPKNIATVEVPKASSPMKAPELETTFFTAAKNQAEQRLGRPLQPQEIDKLTTQTKQIVTEKLGKQPTIAEISGASDARPAAQLQKQIEDAYNAGDMNTVKTLVPQLPDDLRTSTASALGVDLPKDAIKPFESTKLQSRVYERLKAENPESLKSDVQYDTINLKDQADKAAKLITEDKQKAYRIAMGAEESAEHTSTGVNVALSEQALEEGNHALYARLIKNRSLAQTRRGQELVSEKASISDNSTSRYVKELINSRMEKLGNLTFGRQGTKLQRAIGKIDQEVAKVEKRVKFKELDVKGAQAIIDGLACK